jgi:hypothetical protein
MSLQKDQGMLPVEIAKRIYDQAFREALRNRDYYAQPLVYELTDFGVRLPKLKPELIKLREEYSRELRNAPFIDWQVFGLMDGLWGYFPFNFNKYLVYRMKGFVQHIRGWWMLRRFPPAARSAIEQADGRRWWE